LSVFSQIKKTSWYNRDEGENKFGDRCVLLVSARSESCAYPLGTFPKDSFEPEDLFCRDTIVSTKLLNNR
jgi:hypothetical protein